MAGPIQPSGSMSALLRMIAEERNQSPTSANPTAQPGTPSRETYQAPLETPIAPESPESSRVVALRPEANQTMSPGMTAEVAPTRNTVGAIGGPGMSDEALSGSMDPALNQEVLPQDPNLLPVVEPTIPPPPAPAEPAPLDASAQPTTETVPYSPEGHVEGQEFTVDGGRLFGAWYQNPDVGRAQRYWGNGQWTDGERPMVERSVQTSQPMPQATPQAPNPSAPGASYLGSQLTPSMGEMMGPQPFNASPELLRTLRNQGELSKTADSLLDEVRAERDRLERIYNQISPEGREKNKQQIAEFYRQQEEKEKNKPTPTPTPTPQPKGSLLDGLAKLLRLR